MKRHEQRRTKKRAPSVMQMRGGPGPTVTEKGGKVWRIGFNNQDAKGHLESLITSHAILEASKRMQSLGLHGVGYFDNFQTRLDSGAYQTFAAGWLATLSSNDGSWLFLQSLLMEAHPDATDADAKRLLAEIPEQVSAAVGVVAPDFFAAVMEQTGLTRGAPPERVAEIAKGMCAAMPWLRTTTAEPATDSASK